jgi:hypothetical protein
LSTLHIKAIGKFTAHVFWGKVRVDTHVDGLLKRRGAIAQVTLKQIEHIPVIGKQAQAYAWLDSKAGEFQSRIVIQIVV